MFHMLNAECSKLNISFYQFYLISKQQSETTMKADYECMFDILGVYHNQYSIPKWVA